jgi:hypothetical protein
VQVEPSKAVLHETSAESELEFALAVSETQIARNRYMNRAGFSPFQRVFGTTPRLPASMLSDDYLDRDLVLSSGGVEVRRAWEYSRCSCFSLDEIPRSRSGATSFEDYNQNNRPEEA